MKKIIIDVEGIFVSGAVANCCIFDIFFHTSATPDAIQLQLKQEKKMQ
jgi:hypothetical protein